MEDKPLPEKPFIRLNHPSFKYRTISKSDLFLWEFTTELGRSGRKFLPPPPTHGGTHDFCPNQGGARITTDVFTLIPYCSKSMALVRFMPGA